MWAQKAGRAGALLFTRKIWAGILSLFVLSYLARVLNKADFGLIMVPASFLSIMDLLGPSSVSDFIVYKNNEQRPLINEAFWLGFILTCIVLAIVFFMAPVWAYYYHDNRIKSITYILAVGLISNFIASVPIAILKQRMDFNLIIICQAITGTLSQLFALLMAILGAGVYSLALPTAIFPLITAVFLFIKTKPQISFNIKGHNWREMWKYTRYWIGGKVLGRVATDSDSLIIGRTLGLTPLGTYNIASRMSNLVNQHILPILDDVGLPLLSKHNHNYTAVKKQFIYVSRLISLLLIPVYCLLILFANVILHTLFSDKWYDAVLPMRILCLFSLVESITYSTGILYNALGKPRIKFYLSLIYTPLFIVAVWFFSSKGLIIACIVITILRISNFIYNLSVAGKIINLSVIEFIREIRHIIIPNVFIGIVYLVMLRFVNNINVRYIMMVAYLPAIYFTTYLLYKKDMLKNYLILCKIFPKVKKLLA